MRVCEKEDGFGLVGVKDGEWLMSLYGLVRFLASYALRLITVQLRDERRSGTDDSTFIEEGINYGMMIYISIWFKSQFGYTTSSFSGDRSSN